ncbi:MAG: AAA family ATPase [Legionellaceae bacterium]|nr:AAA family ATPase [Legionellaceae bacterium]
MPLKIIDALYYTESSSAANYGTDVTAEFDVQRMIDQKPAWLQPTLPAQKKPKTLIIADSLFNYANDFKKADVIGKLKQLCQANFTLYSWTTSGLQVLEEKDLTQIFWNNSITSALDENISAAAAKHHISKDSILILNDYWLDCLHHDEILTERRLYASEISQIKEEHRVSLIDLLKASMPSVTLLVEDRFNPFTLKDVTWQEQFSDIRKITQWRNLICNQTELEALLSENTTPIVHENYQLDRHALAGLESINITSGVISSKALLMLAREAPRLSSLYVKDVIEPIAITPHSLSNLVSLNLSQSKMSFQDLSALLPAAPHLTTLHLHLSFCESITEPLNLEPSSLNSLVSLDLSRSEMSSQDLAVFLRTAPHLTRINLSHCKSITGPLNLGPLNLEPSSLNSLVSLNLSSSEISSQDLALFLRAAPHLTCLDLSNCKNIAKPFNLEPNSLNSLVSLDLSMSEISSQDLSLFLRAAPHLTSLDLSRCKNITGPLTLEPNSINSLVSLDLLWSEMSSQSLLVLLLAAPHLTNLKLADKNDLSKTLGVGLLRTSLNSMVSLNLSHSKMSLQDLSALFRTTSHLTNLELNYYTNETQVVKLQSESFSGLVSLNLNDSKLTPQGLSALLRAAPHLTKLDLYSYGNEIDAFELAPNSLNSLVSLFLDYTRITPNGLATFVRAAPHLASLSIGYCYGLNKPLTFKPGSLSHLDNIFLYGTKLSQKNLEILAAAAPQLREKILSHRLSDDTYTSHPSDLLPQGATPSSDAVLSDEAPDHNPSIHKTFTPHDESKLFEFNKHKQPKNQTMVINKFSQYLKLTQKHVAMIPKLQNGICKPLACLYQTEGAEKLQALLDTAHSWDGRRETIDDNLKDVFELLWDYVNQYQLGFPISTSYIFTGEKTKHYLAQLPDRHCILIVNPWHRVAVEKLSRDRYQLYDPNAAHMQQYALEALEEALHKQMGTLLALINPTVAIDEPTISNPKAFIASGGLLALIKYDNFTQRNVDALHAIVNTLNHAELEGILLRTTKGMPAWVVGSHKNSQIKSLTENLLRRFRTLHGAASSKLLIESMAAMNGKQKLALAELFIGPAQAETSPVAAASTPDFQEAMLHLCQTVATTHAYQAQLSPWEQQDTLPADPRAYSQMLLRPAESTSNRLVRCSSDEAVLELSRLLVTHAERTHKPVFYIHAPENLRCASPFVERRGHDVYFKKGPGGPLHDFLQQCKTCKTSPIIVVNYTQFDASDMVKFNGLLDTVDPRADGTALPEKACVIGVLNTAHPEVYQGSDFYSRFHEKYDNPFSEELLHEASRPAAFEEEKRGTHQAQIINLFHAPDWKSRLLGHCVLNGTQMHYEEGPLVQALALSAPIVIQNGLWDDDEFCGFIQQLSLGRGVFHAGAWYSMREDQEIRREEGYAWDALVADITVQAGLNPNIHCILNQYTLNQFLGGYVYDAAKQGLVHQPGQIFTQAQEQRLDINLTENLSQDVWARLLTACKACERTLNIHCALGVVLPDAFRFTPTDQTQADPWQASATCSTFHVIISTNSDTTLNIIRNKNPEIFVMSVSGLAPEDLLESMDSTFDQDSVELKITPKQGALMLALNQGQSVLLTGDFSPHLRQALTAFALAQATPPKLILLTEDDTAFQHLGHLVRKHNVTLDEKKAPLGMQRLPANVAIDPSPLDFTQSRAEARAFHHQRTQAVLQSLHDGPYCYLTGLTGVGKTTFVETAFTQALGYTLFHEVGDLVAWATSKASNPVLFLDEANMNARDWGIFEGLFLDPPHIVLNGIYHALSPQHKIIFAGNPNSYGDERKQHAFFERHGRAVLCQPLPKAVLYEDILKPIFEYQEGFELEAIQTACQDILTTYAQVCQGAAEEVLLTPRELQMIALLGLSNAQGSSEPLNMHIQRAITSVITPVLTHKPGLLAQLNTLFPESHERTHHPIAETFSVMPSQSPILAQIQDYLALRDFRVDAQASLNQAQRYGGLGGIVLEGEPGCGKSELAVHALVAAGYQEEHDHQNPTQKEKPFYKMPASMGLTQKKALLEKAFQEGAVVMMDEINSSPMMEHRLNAMLMGLHPETHQRPSKPGFMVIGTQNPISMAGRRVASPALKRRLTTIEFPEYTRDELTHILIQQKNMDETDARALTETYLERRAYAQKNHLTPVPCFRDLYTRAVYETKRTQELPALQELQEPEEQTETDTDTDDQRLSHASLGLFHSPSPPSTPRHDEAKPPLEAEPSVNKAKLSEELTEYIAKRSEEYRFHWDIMWFKSLVHWLSAGTWIISKETKLNAATYALHAHQQEPQCLARVFTLDKMPEKPTLFKALYKNSYVLIQQGPASKQLYYVDYFGCKTQVNMRHPREIKTYFDTKHMGGKLTYGEIHQNLSQHVDGILPTDAQLHALKDGRLGRILANEDKLLTGDVSPPVPANRYDLPGFRT